MSQKKYTLVRKNSIVGPLDEKTKKASYIHNRGDVIDEAAYKKLIKRHQDQFDEGVVELNKKKSGKDKANDEAIENLTARVEALEAAVGGKAEPEADTDSKKAKTASKDKK